MGSSLFYEKHLPKGRYDSRIRKVAIVAIMKLFHKDRIFTKRINDMIDSYVAVHPEILNGSRGGVTKKWIFNDILFCVYVFGINADEYFTFDFINKNYRGRKEYFTLGHNMKRLCANYNKTEDVHILDKKVDLYKKLKPFFKRDIVSVT